MSPVTLSSFPEELLERILFHCAVAPLSQPARPSWHTADTNKASTRGRIALLLVSKTFLRICTPLFYHTVHITSPFQLHCLLYDALRPNACLATYIRRLVLGGVWSDAGELLRMCNVHLRTLDVTLDMTHHSPGFLPQARDVDAEKFCEGLKEIRSLTHIVIRKPGNVYLTQPKPRCVLAELAKAMCDWDEIEHADLAFRLSDDSGSVAARTATQGPITAMTSALSTRPKLHTLSTMLPSVWNESILRISTNPSLERIILGDGTGSGRGGITWSARDYAGPVLASFEGPQGIPSTGLFFLQAKKHTRLCELIRAGTSIMRARAQTIGTHMLPPPPSFVSSSSNAHHTLPAAGLPPSYFARPQGTQPSSQLTRSRRSSVCNRAPAASGSSPMRFRPSEASSLSSSSPSKSAHLASISDHSVA